MNQAKPARSRMFSLITIAIQLAALALVGWGIWRTALNARNDLAESSITLRDLHWGWLIVSGVLYLFGAWLFGLFWHRVLLAMRQTSRLWPAQRAYFLSQPGKYVPGKFMVVALRTKIIRAERVDVTIAIASCFVETLSIMSLGAVLGAVLLPVVVAADWRLEVFAVCTAIGVGLPTLPPVIRWVVQWTRLHRLHPEIDRSLEELTVRRLLPGWIAVMVGWFAMGGSLGATLLAMPNQLDRELTLTDLPLLTASAGLSTVAGFVSLLPAGIGAREWVVMETIKPHFGATAALLSAVVNRCVMIVADLLVCLPMSYRGRRGPEGGGDTETRGRGDAGTGGRGDAGTG